MKTLPFWFALAALLALTAGRWCHADEAPKEIGPRECLVIAPVGSYGRSPLHADAVEALVVSGKWSAPKAGDPVKLPDGTSRKWEKAEAGKDGAFAHKALVGGYAFFAI